MSCFTYYKRNRFYESTITILIYTYLKLGEIIIVFVFLSSDGGNIELKSVEFNTGRGIFEIKYSTIILGHHICKKSRNCLKYTSTVLIAPCKDDLGVFKFQR